MPLANGVLANGFLGGEFDEPAAAFNAWLTIFNTSAKMKKNVAGQSVGAQMITISDGSAFTGTVTVLVTIDNGTQSASAGAAPVHEGNGYHSYSPTQAETNGDHIAFTFTGTGAITQTKTVETTFPQTVDNATGIADIPTTAEFELRTVTSGTYATSASITALNDFNPVSDAVANVTLVATTTNNTDMRGTDSAATAVNLATVDSNVDAILVDTGTTIPANQTAINNNVLLIDTATMRGTDGANTTTPPTTAQIWAETTRVLTSGANIALAKGIGVTGFNDITAASVLAAGDIDGFTLEEAQKLTLSMGVGVLSGAATNTITIQAADGSKARITATVDADGNRSAVIKDVTG